MSDLTGQENVHGNNVTVEEVYVEKHSDIVMAMPVDTRIAIAVMALAALVAAVGSLLP